MAPTYDAGMSHGWVEIGDRVYVRRYAFFDQNIVAVVGREETLVLDTRTTYPQAREIIDDLRLLGAPPVTIVVNSHGHYDHAFGNAVFRPATIWGHERCVAMLERFGEPQREAAAAALPDLAAELAEVELVPPRRTFARDATICMDDGREVELRYLGRGHTDNDIVLRVADADIVCAGDLLENGAVPYFGDGYPLDWPATADALLALVGDGTVVVPGHGDHAGRAFVEESLSGFRAVVSAAERVHAGTVTLEEGLALTRYGADSAREPVERALAQLRGELDPDEDQPATRTTQRPLA